MIVEPADSVFLDPKTGRELKSGTKVVIRTADGKSFREFALFLHDFALLFDKNSEPLNPPEHPGSDDDPGVMGINYRCEPMRERLKIKNDPAHIFSSFIYGDPRHSSSGNLPTLSVSVCWTERTRSNTF